MATLDEHARAGITAINEQRYDDAIVEFQKAIALDADRPDLNNALGMAYMHRGEVGSALPYLEKAVQLAQAFTGEDVQEMKLHMHVGLASAYEIADRIRDARRVLENAVAKWPDKVEPRLQLGQLLLSSCQLDDGLAVYRALATHKALDDERKKAAQVVVDAVRAFRESDQPAGIFLQAHAESYRHYFDEVAAQPVSEGWYAEAARMGRGADGEIKPIVTEGSRPYAMQRVDLVNPADGSVASVHTEQEPMVVAINGLEPLAQLPILLPWKEQAFEIWVCSRCPWHWLQITVQFARKAEAEAMLADLDGLIGDWYLAGFNGDFGTKESGRFHYVTDPEPLGDRAFSYVFDLGRARYDAIPALLQRLAILHERRPIDRVIFGQGRLPD